MGLLTSHSQGLGQNGGTTTGINTTGARLLVVHVGSFSPAVVSDSRGNTWTSLTVRDGGDPRSQIFYCLNPSVGVGHTITVTGAESYAAISILVFDDAVTFAAESGATAIGVAVSAGSLTPQVGSLMICGQCLGADSASEAVSSPYVSTASRPYQGGAAMASYLSWHMAGIASALNPSWTGASVQRAATHAMFHPAAPPRAHNPLRSPFLRSPLINAA